VTLLQKYQKSTINVVGNIERRSSMTTVKVNVNSIDKVKGFVNTIVKFDNDFDLVAGRYVIDAKSIMGIFSLDLSQDLELHIGDGDPIEDIRAALKDYIVE
jgi:phosphotransferase system HPr-like phosphotransfer protein